MAFYRLYMVTRPGPGPTLSFFWCYLQLKNLSSIIYIDIPSILSNIINGICSIFLTMYIYIWIICIPLDPSACSNRRTTSRCPLDAAAWIGAQPCCRWRCGSARAWPAKMVDFHWFHWQKRGFYQENIWSLAIEKHLPWIRIVSPKDRDLRDINIEI